MSKIMNMSMKINRTIETQALYVKTDCCWSVNRKNLQQTSSGQNFPLKGNYCRSVAIQIFVLSVDSLDECCSLGKEEVRHDVIIF